MNITNGLPYFFKIEDAKAQELQVRYRFFYCDSRNGTHLVFTSRHYAEKFALQELKLDNQDFGISEVYTENWKKVLGYQIKIIFVPTAEFVKVGTYEDN